MKKILIFLAVIIFLVLFGYLFKGNSDDVIKITSETSPSKFTFNGKVVSLKTGINLLKAGKIDEAIKFFNEYQDFFSDNPKYYYYSGQAYFKKGLYQKASACFEKALSFDNTNYNLYLDLAHAYEKAKNNNKAAENLVNYVFKSNDLSKNPEIRNELNRLACETLGSGVVGRISVTDQAELTKNSAIGLKQAFSSETPVIFASIELINSKENDVIQANWNFINNNGETIPVNSSKFSYTGSKTVLLSIKNPVTGWPIGKYELQILTNGTKNSTKYFYIF